MTQKVKMSTLDIYIDPPVLRKAPNINTVPKLTP